jgi:flagellar P-ring protein precursor FlgI
MIEGAVIMNSPRNMLGVMILALLKAALSLAFVLLFLAATGAHAERIKDLASVQGIRPNQLIGYGIVVGLDNSGDQTTQTPFTTQSIANMLGQMGVNLAADQVTNYNLKMSQQ